MNRNSYIVRIYTSYQVTDQEKGSEPMTGIVEDTDTGTKYTFHNKEELWGFMTKYQGKILSQSNTTN